MTTLTSSIQIALNTPSNINTEVSAQLAEARDLIGNYQAAQSLTNRLITLVPRMVKAKDVQVTFKDDRDELTTVSKDLNDIMWLITLQSTLESGTATTAGLVALFKQWAKNEMKATWSDASLIPIAKRFIRELMNQGIISPKQEAREIAGQIRKVFVLTDAMVVEVSDTVDTLREAVPMKCKPLTNRPTDWTDNNNGIGEGARIKLVTGGKHTKIAQPVLDAVNKLQSVPFVISNHMVTASRLMLDNVSEYGIDAELVRILHEIRKYKGETVFFPVTMDKRGRMYYRGGLLSPQGTDFCKAAFQFATSKPLGDNGFEAIAIHTANVCGMDKISYNDRVSWVMANIDSGTFASITDFEDVINTFPNADTFQATVAILEINRILALDIDPALVSSNLVCHQDGTCNGLQHMAALTGSRETAISVNCVESTKDDVPSDIYGIIASEAATLASGDVLDLINKYGRKMAKTPVMIVGYGAGKETVCKTVTLFLHNQSENAKLGYEIGELYMQALENKASAVKSFTAALTSRMEEAMISGVTSVRWTSADGFISDISYTNPEEFRVRAGNFNCMKAHDSAPMEPIKTRGALAPNLVHSIDSAHLRMVVNACDFDLVTVHDSIGSHPSDFFATATAVREQFVAVHSYDVLADLTSSLNVDPINFINKRRATGYNASEALNSTYIFS
jgi:hypothetical protein